MSRGGPVDPFDVPEPKALKARRKEPPDIRVAPVSTAPPLSDALAVPSPLNRPEAEEVEESTAPSEPVAASVTAESPAE